MNESAEEQICAAAWKKTRLFSVVMLAAPVLYVVIGLMIRRRQTQVRLFRLSEDLTAVIFAVFMGVGVLCFLAAAVIRGRMLSEVYVARYFRSMGQVAQYYVQMALLSFSLCQSSAVMGLVYFLLTGDVGKMVVLAGLGVVFSLVLFPRRGKLEELVRRVKDSGDTRGC